MNTLTLQKDPTGNHDFLVDEYDSVFYLDNQEPVFCQFHTSTQIKSNEGWMYCPDCERELNGDDSGPELSQEYDDVNVYAEESNEF